jgi:hypothetical protein
MVLMSVMMDDPDEYWEGFTDAEFLEYLDSYPEPVVPEYDCYEHLAGSPWPMSIERRRWDYDGGWDYED